MSAYVLFQFDPTDPDTLQEHGSHVMRSAQEFEGEFLLPPSTPEMLEGEAARAMSVLMRFDSKEKAKAWYNSESYAPGKKVREGELNMLITLLG